MVDTVVNFLTRPEMLFLLAVAGLVAAFRFAEVWTRPKVALGIGLGLLAFGVWAPIHHHGFARNLGKPDNIPIVMVVVLLYVLFWLAMRQAVENDRRIEEGRPPREAEEKNRKVLVWPDLVYTELIAMVVCTVILVVWSILIPAPLEEPANAARTPNPAKAPWYFLGLQEILVYFDPWWAGVGLPGTIILGLVAIPYVDRNPKGNGYYTLRERKGAIFTFCFGFFVLWVLLAFVGTFLRGPGWNFFGLFQDHSILLNRNLNNINLSEIVWVKILGMREPAGVLAREMWGFLALAFWFGVVPVALATTVMKRQLREWGALRYGLVVNLGLLMMAVPVKMILRWTLNLKYIVYWPDIQMNI